VGAVLQIHPECTATVEAAWHRRLREHGVDVPDVLANTCGEFATWVDNGRAGQAPQVCMLFEWVAGRSLRNCLTERRAVALGSLSARLHQEAADWCPPGGAAVLRADRVLYWQLPQNVLVAPKRGLVLIDFQDTVVGFDVQDLSITVSALRRFPEGGQLIEAFRTGYSEVRPWPDISPALFDSLIAARALHQLNLTLNIVDMAGLGDYIASHAERARGWMHRPTGL
jgi:Ser/Thr protein kinase RdoA (MazF antagonist)